MNLIKNKLLIVILGVFSIFSIPNSWALESYVGELFKTENSDDFSKSVLELYKNSEKLKTYSLNCKIAIENHLNNEIVSQQIVSMYAK